MTKKRTRQVHVGIEVSADLPDTWRLYAERCAACQRWAAT